jgi:hypothetical protein
MSIAQETVRGATVSDAWMSAVVAVNAAPGQTLFHLVSRIDDPLAEQPQIRAAADTLLADLGHSPIVTVANTVFPAQMAATSGDHGDLGARYRRVYPTIRRLDRNNRHGTYFGRIVAHPGAGGDHDQLAELIRRLGTELQTRGPKSARYEMSLSAPGDPVAADPAGQNMATAALPVYAPGLDNSPMGFPCLSFCSFQLDRDRRLHMVAHYRRQHLIVRGYGNYLGIGQLLGYVCGMTGLLPGELMIVAGVAQVDAPMYRIGQLVAATSAE